METIEEHLELGASDLREGKLEAALEHYRQAMALDPPETDYLQVANTTAQVYDWLGRKKDAEAQYRENLMWLETNRPQDAAARATTLNNLGRLLGKSDLTRAVNCFDEACGIFRGLAEGDPLYGPHLANTLTARGGAFTSLEKYWYAKKDYKEALAWFENRNTDEAADRAAWIRYQLGGIYQEEFNGHDARLHYLRALKHYKARSETDRDAYLPMLAACQNNLARIQADLDEHERARELFEDTLESYDLLSSAQPDTYLPYLAATYTSLGILLSEKLQAPGQALKANGKALGIYRELSRHRPGTYSHYLATALHNTGVYHAQQHNWEAAAASFEEALELRRELSAKEPRAFAADFCATALNLLEVWQELPGRPGAEARKQQALTLAEEAESRLTDLEESAVTRNMRADLEELSTQFRESDPAETRYRGLIHRISELDEEIDGTTQVAEKMGYQQQILDLLQPACRDHPDHSRLQQAFLRALSNAAWFALCNGRTAQAGKYIEKGLTLDPDSASLCCNRVHYLLLEGREPEARKLFAALKGRTDGSGKPCQVVIREDWQRLAGYGVFDPADLPDL